MGYMLPAMAVDEQRQAKPLDEVEKPAKRLVKTWLPVELVRKMDVAIVRSAGGYLDRAEFIAEAISDRLDEDEAAAAAPAAPEPVRIGGGSFGDWLDDNPATLPAADGPAENFGLHNRDFPTLWALDCLGRAVAEHGAPVGFGEFVAELMPRAWEMGRELAGANGGSAASGFPTNAKRRAAAEQRFATHAIGVTGARGNSGPLFVFGLVGLDGYRAAPTDAALRLVLALREIGFTPPPFAPGGWEAFSQHLAEAAPLELEAWLSVLGSLVDGPTRTELVARSTRWPGSTAATNAASYVARGREWGLVEPQLVDGRYRLTEFGRSALGGDNTSERRKEKVA